MYYENYVKAKKLRNIKDADVTRATGITSSTLSEWKKGKYTPKADKLQAIADFLKVSIEYLVTGKEYDDPPRMDPDTAAAVAAISGDMTMMMIVSMTSKLNREGKEKVLAYAKDLFASGLYILSQESSAS